MQNNSHKRAISGRVLERLAREIGIRFSTNQIVSTFEHLGIPTNRELFAKWRISLDAFEKASKQSQELVFQCIEEFLHPLNFENEIMLAAYAKSYRDILKFDGLTVVKTSGGLYKIMPLTEAKNHPEEQEPIPQATESQIIEQEYQELSVEEIKNLFEERAMDAEEKKRGEEDEKEIIKKSIADIEHLDELYRLYSDVIETFCTDCVDRPTKELNDAYLYLKDEIKKIVKKLGLLYYQIYFYIPFEGDLFSAENEWKHDIMKGKIDGKIEWSKIRPELYLGQSTITKILKIARPDNEVDADKKMSNIKQIIDNTRNKAEKGKALSEDKSLSVHKHEHIHEHKIKYENDDKPKTSLKDFVVNFDDDAPAIHIGKNTCALPPFKNEHFFARAMFQYKLGEAVDWSIVHNKMTGTDQIGKKKDEKSLRDTMDRLNNRIKEIINTDDELFSWENKSVKRNF